MSVYATSAPNSSTPSPTPAGPRIFGVPYGDFGLFASILISFSLGFATFFLVTFLSIFTILIYNGVAHQAIDLSHGYKFVAFPAGLIALALSLVTLGTVWLRRRLLGK